MLEIDTANGPRFGSLQYQTSLELGSKEVVLTFDDGPHPENTKQVLNALKEECVQATFFPVGVMAEAYPETLLAVARHGHTIGAHSWSHPNLQRMSAPTAKNQIDKGFKAITAVAKRPIAPFFRFPGLNDSKTLKSYAAERGYAIFSCDISSDDWRGIGPRTIVKRTMARLNRREKGIVLFHDTKRATAAAIPMLLRALKRQDYKIVHVVPRNGYGSIQTASTEKTTAMRTHTSEASASRHLAGPY